jgi:hypothetical protein
LQTAFKRLLSLEMTMDECGMAQPQFLHVDEDARLMLDEFRQTVRGWETGADGLLLSFIGKLQGLTLRLSLIFAYLDWAGGDEEIPKEISKHHYGRAVQFVEVYILPMARRAYADASMPKAERAARRLVSIIREQGWRGFSTRDVMRMERTGLSNKLELDPALDLLEATYIICSVSAPATAKGGRPPRLFNVNPALWGAE